MTDGPMRPTKPTKPFHQYRYGVSTRVFVVPKAGGQTAVIGGVCAAEGRWTRVLTLRAAKLLWFNLTRLLFPGKAAAVTALAETAPLQGRSRPSMTYHVEVTRAADSFIEIIGWAGQEMWWARLPENEARALWTRLDLMLYPVGWEGRDNRRGHSSTPPEE